MSHNYLREEEALGFIQHVLHERFNFEGNAKVTTIQHDPDDPFMFNKSIFRVSMSEFLYNPQDVRRQQPGCVAIPTGATEFIMRLNNPDSDGISNPTRIENEVAMTYLASMALSGFNPHIVPSIYAWGSAANNSSQGWILQEFMPGKAVGEVFHAMDLEGKRNVFEQQAIILKELQDYKLPENLSIGGVTFDENGHIVSSTMTKVDAGPWPTFEASYKERLQLALEKADANPYLQGWRANGVRDRLDAFFERGISPQFGSLGAKDERVIVHTELGFSNILFDKKSGRITALLNYDWACISHPLYEFLRSFRQSHNRFADDVSGQMEAGIMSFPSILALKSLRAAPAPDGISWEVVQVWEESLEKLKVKRPSNISGGIENVAHVDAILKSIWPWWISTVHWRMQSNDEIMGRRADCENSLIKLLDHVGY